MPVTTYRDEVEYVTQTRVKYVEEPVVTERVEKVCTGRFETVTEYVPGPVVTRCVRLPGTCVFDPCTCTSHYCPGPVVQQQVQCPGHTVCKKVWVPTEECRIVRECKMVCKPVCETVQVPVCRKVCQHRDADLPARRSAAWCPSSACATKPARAATRFRKTKVCQMPYTTCRMVPEHVRADARRGPMLLGSRTSRPLLQCYTTCRMVPETHCRW